MSVLDQPRIAILKAGTFTDANGTTVSFTQRDLERVASSYDAAGSPAALVVGHPANDTPARGWVRNVSFDGETLFAEPERVDQSFRSLVRAGRFRKVSASLWPPSHAANPKPGAWYLKHVGFLGAQAPAIKGLGTVALSQGGQACVTVAIDTGATALPIPAGHRVDGDSLATMARADAIRSRDPRLSFWQAVQQAKREESIASFAEASDAGANARIAVAHRASQILAEFPTLSFGDAMSRARREVAFPNGQRS